jgi:hypothetical protein
MEARKKDRRPGDLILDRYTPNATPEQREAAREYLREFAALLYGVHDPSLRPPSAIRPKSRRRIK